MKLDMSSSVPVYRQIVEFFQFQIARGELKANDPLPSVRELAVLLRINPNTVVHAYQEMTHLGLIEKRKGVGAFVSENAEQKKDEERKRQVLLKIEELLVYAQQLGFNNEDVIKMMGGKIK